MLSLENNSIGNVGLETMAASLMKNRTLKYLDLSYNNIQDGAVNGLCNMIKNNSVLKVLYLHGNQYDTEILFRELIFLIVSVTTMYARCLQSSVRQDKLVWLC